VTTLALAVAVVVGLFTLGALAMWAACAVSGKLDDELSHMFDDDDDY